MKTFIWNDCTPLPPRVRVYRNLNKAGPNAGCWSIKDKRRGLVVLHAASIILTNVEFVVSEAGRSRVLREKSKNVHAYVEGDLVAADVLTERYEGFYSPSMVVDNPNGYLCTGVQSGEVEISYNPYRTGSFYRVDDGSSIESAMPGDYVHLHSDHKVSLVPYNLSKVA